MVYAGYSKALLIDSEDHKTISLNITTEIKVNEKAYTHKNIYGHLIEYNRDFSLSIQSLDTDKEIIEDLHNRKLHKFTVIINGFRHKLIFTQVNISVKINREYPKKFHSLTILISSTEKDNSVLLNEENLILDLQADSLQDGIVSLWQDESGLANHFTQSVEIEKPIKDVSGVAFDGVDDYLSLNTDNDDFNFTDGNGNDIPYTVIFIAQQAEMKALNAIFWAVAPDNYFIWYDIDILIEKNYSDPNANGYIDSHISYSEIDTLRVMALTYDGTGVSTGIKIYMDGIDQSASGGDNLYIGMEGGVRKPYVGKFEDVCFHGSIETLKVYKRELSAQEIADQYNYLKARYGL